MKRRTLDLEDVVDALDELAAEVSDLHEEPLTKRDEKTGRALAAEARRIADELTKLFPEEQTNPKDTEEVKS